MCSFIIEKSRQALFQGIVDLQKEKKLQLFKRQVIEIYVSCDSRIVKIIHGIKNEILMAVKKMPLRAVIFSQFSSGARNHHRLLFQIWTARLIRPRSPVTPQILMAVLGYQLITDRKSVV